MLRHDHDERKRDVTWWRRRPARICAAFAAAVFMIYVATNHHASSEHATHAASPPSIQLTTLSRVTPAIEREHADTHRSRSHEDMWLHDQRFFCTVAPFMIPKETTEKHIVFGQSISFVMFLLPFGRDIVSTEIHSHRGWDNSRTREMLRIMQGHKPRLGYSIATAPTYIRTPDGEMSEEEQSRVFLDIGANIGWFTLNIAAGGYRVISFEPLQHNEIALRSSICRNPGFVDRVRFYNIGLGAEEGKCAVYSESKNVGDGHVICRTDEEIEEARRIIATGSSTEATHAEEKLRIEEERKRQHEQQIDHKLKYTREQMAEVDATQSHHPENPTHRRLLQDQLPTSPSILPAPASPPPSTEGGAEDELFPSDLLEPEKKPVYTPVKHPPGDAKQRAYFRRQKRLVENVKQASLPSESNKMARKGPSSSAVDSSTHPVTPVKSPLNQRPFDLTKLKSYNRTPVRGSTGAHKVPREHPPLPPPTILPRVPEKTFPNSMAVAEGSPGTQETASDTEEVQSSTGTSGPATPLSSTALIRLKSLALTREWNTTGLIKKGYYVRNELRVVRLDSMVHEPIHLLKMDVEGFEAQVLRGATGLFDTVNRPKYIIAEFSPDMLQLKGGDPTQDFLQFFHQRGYHIRLIQHGFNIDRLVEPSEFDTFCRSHPLHLNRQCELFMARSEDIE